MIEADGRERPLGLLAAGDPKGEVKLAWHAKEIVRSLYDDTDPDLALTFVTELARDLQSETMPPEIRQLGRTMRRLAASDRRMAPGTPDERIYRSIEQSLQAVKRVGFGFTRFRTYRVRFLVYAGRPNWDRVQTSRTSPCRGRTCQE